MLNVSSASRVLCYFLFALPGGGGGGEVLAYEGYKGTSSGIKTVKYPVYRITAQSLNIRYLRVLCSLKWCELTFTSLFHLLKIVLIVK